MCQGSLLSRSAITAQKHGVYTSTSRVKPEVVYVRAGTSLPGTGSGTEHEQNLYSTVHGNGTGQALFKVAGKA